MGVAQQPNQPFILFGLILTLMIAGIIRYQGVWFGYPLPLHPDEPYLLENALRMLATGDLNPRFFFYPTLNIYLQALVYQLTQNVGYWYLTHFSGEENILGIPVIWMYIAGRLFNLLLSVMTIFVTFQIGKRLLSPLAGLFAAVFLSFSYLHIVNSYLLTVDTTVAFWASLAALMAVMVHSEGARPLFYLLGGVFAGLAIGSKYTAFVAAIPLLVAHWSQTGFSKPRIDRNLVAYLLIIPLVFFATSPYVLLDFNTFRDAIVSLSAQYKAGHPGAMSATSTSYWPHASYLFRDGYGIAPTLFALCGMALLFRNSPWKALLVTTFPILLFLLVGRYKTFFPRNIVALIPFMALLSGYFLACVHEAVSIKARPVRESMRGWVAGTLLVAILAGSVWGQASQSIAHIRKITLPDTRWISLQWIEENLPAYSRIGREHYTPPIERYTEKFRALYLGFFGTIKYPAELEKLDYMVVSSSDYERFLAEPDRYPEESRAYLNFFNANELVIEFVPEPGQTGGPRISIFKLEECPTMPCLDANSGKGP